MTRRVTFDPALTDATVDPSTARLDAETYELKLCGHIVNVSLAYHSETKLLHEVVFVKRPGKEGQDLHEIFHEFGIQFSRIIQGRDPAKRA